MKRTAIFSPDRLYRYKLEISWDLSHAPLAVIGLNPSTADEISNDPTVERCERRARSWGYGGLVMLNLFAFRATNPKDMLAESFPVGDHNLYWLERETAGRTVLCAWGTHGKHMKQDETVMELLFHDDTRCLGVNKNGTPKHPLYVPYSQGLEIFN